MESFQVRREGFNHVYDNLHSVLKDINKRRNIVAHAFIVHGTEPKVRRLNKNEEQILDEKFLEKFYENLEIAFVSINELIKVLTDSSNVHKNIEK